ncbi:HTH domain-containing protein [Carnobacterium maltaromaticum]|uniref:HTH domain-containing protein n=1 Tax=Carnobacterium maltaromaticum TaxID=2751 RepID=UPI0018CCF4AF|nr:HTH domain-containing protein [Carnobacterium maltaromaticum]
MLEHTDKIIFRKIEILKILDRKNDFMSTHDLAELLNLSTKTVSKELVLLCEELDKSGLEIGINRDGFLWKILKNDSMNMDELYLMMKKNSIYFNLLRQAMLGEKDLKGSLDFYGYSYLYKKKK